MSIGHFQAMMAAASELVEEYVLTAGLSGNVTGYDLGAAAIGSLVPDTFDGEQIQAIATVVSAPDRLQVQMVTPALGQDFFNEIEIVGQGTFETANADSYQDSVGGHSFWSWDNPGFLFNDAQVYNAIMRR